jgi:hypothetical protein
MKLLNRLRIIIFAFAVFGAFANFAQNEWGNNIIIVCHLLLALSFLSQAIYVYYRRITSSEAMYFNIVQLAVLVSTVVTFLYMGASRSNVENGIVFLYFFIFIGLLLTDGYISLRRTRKGIIYTHGVFENIALFVVFLGMFFKNVRWPGAWLLLVMGITFMAMPYYIIQTVYFFRRHYKQNKMLIIVLTTGSVSAILLGLTVMFKILHYPGGNLLFYSGSLLTIVMVAGTIKWNYEVEGKRINIFKALGMFHTNIVPLYFAVVTYCFYGYLRSKDVVPDFYVRHLPPVVKELDHAGKPDEARATAEAYIHFIQNAEKNGFLK